MDRCIRLFGWRGWGLALGLGIAGAMNSAPAQAQELCGGVDYPFPYTDVSSVAAAFCPGIMEAYVTGVSKGTTPTTFSPDETVTRVQMTTFLQRSLDQGLTRTSRRAALRHWWTPLNPNAMQTIAVADLYGQPQSCDADGADIWVAGTHEGGGTVVQVQANTGKILGTWVDLSAGNTDVVLALAGKVFVAGSYIGDSEPGRLFEIDPTQSPGVPPQVAVLAGAPEGIAFDGNFLWTANQQNEGFEGPLGTASVSGIAPTPPYAVYSVSTGFTSPSGILFDGANIWVTDSTANKLFKLVLGSIVQTVTVGSGPVNPVFDGANIWVPNSKDNSITVVQASTGTVVATIIADASNMLNGPGGASFDGERILVANRGGNSVTLFKAADLSFIANVTTGPSSGPTGPCSDGIDFWVPLGGTGNLLRF
jgi:hypothetical protein